MKNPILEEITNECVFEEIAENTVVAGVWSTFKVSPVSKAMGNKGSICTGTIECQNNCT